MSLANHSSFTWATLKEHWLASRDFPRIVSFPGKCGNFSPWRRFTQSLTVPTLYVGLHTPSTQSRQVVRTPHQLYIIRISSFASLVQPKTSRLTPIFSLSFRDFFRIMPTTNSTQRSPWTCSHPVDSATERGLKTPVMELEKWCLALTALILIR